MNIGAVISAIVVILCFLLAVFGVAPGGTNMALVGGVFVGLTLLFMNLPAVWSRRA